MVFVAYLFPTKINPPELIFLPILTNRCIQRVIKFSVNIDYDIKIDVSSLILGDHGTHHKNIILLSATSNVILQLCLATYRKRLADCINVAIGIPCIMDVWEGHREPSQTEQCSDLLERAGELAVCVEI